MKLWIFNCTDKDRQLVSARVAAPTVIEARRLIGKAFGKPGGILAFFGEDCSIETPAILSSIAKDEKLAG